ncbi:MAG TPA: ubiquinol oxidase subunit II, partial [Patescibacteria group bacterium]|nr:ubiquinol oxidase subunit II [Patescibacteria group bacterium]
MRKLILKLIRRLAKFARLVLALVGVGFVTLAFVLIKHHDMAVFSPSGIIADKESRLIFTATALMLIIVVPVFLLTIFIAWRYRAGNTKAKYSPDWDHNLAIETLWWVLPLIIIGTLSVVAWRSSYELDPFKKLSSSEKPMTIQVVALQWKWLFIYPDQDIASVNYVRFPANRPIDFEITADAPMNSFWIPKLGGQIYAMSGMSTHLHLMASETGTFNGSSANISGEGFASMRFTAQASSENDFETWLKDAKKINQDLSLGSYERLAEPSLHNPVAIYS